MIKLVMSMTVAFVALSAVAHGEGAGHLRFFRYAGTACPYGSLDVEESANGDELQLIFDSTIASSPSPYEPSSSRRRHCQVILSFDRLQGYSFAIRSFQIDGYASLASRVQSTIESLHSFGSGASYASKAIASIDGPIVDTVHTSSVISSVELAWSPCNSSASLNIMLQTFINTNRNPRSINRIGDPNQGDGQVKLIYGLVWRRCS